MRPVWKQRETSWFQESKNRRKHKKDASKENLGFDIKIGFTRISGVKKDQKLLGNAIDYTL